MSSFLNAIVPIISAILLFTITILIFSKVKMDWNKIIDSIQSIMIFLLIVIVAVCILTLVSFDGVVGTGSMLYLTNKNLRASVGISLATSGLLISLMFLGYSFVTKYKNPLIKTICGVILVVAGLIYILDVCFDGLTADYLRFGEFVLLSNYPPMVIITQWMFRLLMGGLSTVGEALAVAIILGMPVLKSIISESLSKNSGNQPKQPQHQQRTSHKPNRQPSYSLSEILDKFPKG